MQNEVIVEGWLLGREQRSTPNGLELSYWLSGATGARCVMVPAQPWQAFVLAEQETQWRQWFGQRSGWRLQVISAQDFSGRPQLALYVYQQALWHQVQQQATSAHWPLLERDIRGCDRYLMERFIRGGMQAKINQNQIMAAKPGKPSHLPSMVSLDLECHRDGHLYSIGLYAEADKRVFMIGPTPAASTPPATYLTYVENEAALLMALLGWFEQYDPDIIIGWSVAQFDLALLQRRAQQHQLRLTLGRDGSEPKWHERAGPGRDCHISGRLVLDGIEWLRAAFYHFDSYALDNVAFALLGEGKACIDPPNRLAEIEHNFHHNKPALAHYNLKDCELVWRIFKHTKLLEFVLAKGQLTGLELDRLGGSVAAFTFRYLPLLHRAGFIAPDLTPSHIEPSPGGYVMNSIPGRFKHVLVLDFKSLYPSIIRTFLIDPMGMVLGAKASDDERINGFCGAHFHRQHHRLPALVAELAEQREQAKCAKDQPLSQAIKILMNSFYGVLGASGCRFHHPHLASSITLRGHQIMKRTCAWIEQQGHKVIYGDTDSLFVHIGDDQRPSQAQQIGQQLVQQVNQLWQQRLAAQGLTSALELEFETHYHHFFMPTIRGSEQGSKKRYVGTVVDKHGASQLIFKGMEAVRSDWTPFARHWQQQLYQSWFAEVPITSLVRTLIEEIQAGKWDEQLVYRKRLRQQLADYHANAPHVRAALKANQVAREHQQPLPYAKGSVVRYVITLNGPQVYGDDKPTLDYQHYIEKQLKPIVEPILAMSHLSFDAIYSSQLGLF